MKLSDRIADAWATLTMTASPVRREKSMTSLDRHGDDSQGSGFGGKFGGDKSPGALGGSWVGVSGLDYQALRNRSRLAKWESTEAEGLVGRLVDNIIGTGLSIQSAPIWELIEPKATSEDEETVERRHRLKRDIEIRHNLFLNSTEPDATGTRSGYNLQAFEASSLFWDGEVFKIFRYSSDPGRMSPLYFQFFLADQVCNPGASEIAAAKARGNYITEGIELTPEGREVAIYVTPDPLTTMIATTRIPFWSKDGKRRFVAHPKITDKPGQVRGVPLLANVLHELTKITDAKVAELEAMVLNALFAVWKRPSDKASTGSAPTGIGKPSSTTAAGAATRVDESGRTTFLRPGIMFPTLKAGEALESFDTKRPNLNVTAFIDQIMTGVSSSKGLSVEMLSLKFNTAYTAARAAMLQTWVKIEMWRDILDSQSIGLEFAAWFTEEVAARRIKAPGFGKSPVMNSAWLNHTLLGSSMPSIDPLKEVSAVEKRLALGHTTGEREAMRYNGTDFTENVARQKVENVELAEARAPIDGTGVASAPVQGELDFAEKVDPRTDPESPQYNPNFDASNDEGAES